MHGYVVAINELEYVMMPAQAGDSVFKYMSATDEWKEMAGLSGVYPQEWSHWGYTYDESNNLLLIADGDKLHSLNFAKETKTARPLSLDFQVDSMIVVDAKIHLFGYKGGRENKDIHCLVDRDTLEMTTDTLNPVAVGGDLRSIMHQQSGDRIILYKTFLS